MSQTGRLQTASRTVSIRPGAAFQPYRVTFPKADGRAGTTYDECQLLISQKLLRARPIWRLCEAVVRLILGNSGFAGLERTRRENPAAAVACSVLHNEHPREPRSFALRE
jgi:hypothetical protein